MTKAEIKTIINFGSSHQVYIPGIPLGVTKFQAFLAIKHILKGRMYWYALKEAYTSSDNLYHYRVDLKMAFKSNEPDRHFLMSKGEKNFVLGLPDKVTIYRAMSKDEQASAVYGVSWTLSQAVAKFFKNTHVRNYATSGTKKVIVEAMVNKKDIIAYFDERSESEIIYAS
jgi:hypothetical protein